MTLDLLSAPHLPQAKTALLQQVQHSSTALVTEYPLLLSADLSQQLLQAAEQKVQLLMQQQQQESLLPFAPEQGD